MLDRQVALAQAALMRPSAEGAICAVIVYAAQPEEHDLAVPTLVLVPEADRTELLARMSPYEALAEVANPERDGYVWAEPEVDEMRDQAAVLMPELEAAGVLDPHRWVYVRIARALTERVGILAIVFDENFSNELVENMRFAATPPVAAAWEALGLLARRDPRELSGGELPFEERVAVVEDAYDEQFEPTGLFNAHSHALGAEDGPWGVTLEEALAWAREHADPVILRIEDKEYSAGAEPVPGLPVWRG